MILPETVTLVSMSSVPVVKAILPAKVFVLVKVSVLLPAFQAEPDVFKDPGPRVRFPPKATVPPVVLSVPPDMDPNSEIAPPLLDTCPSDIDNDAESVRLFPTVIIFSLASSIVTELVTVRLVEARVRAKLARFRVAMVSFAPIFSVVFPPSARVAETAVKVAPEAAKVPAPVKDSVLPDTSMVPLVMVVAAGRVMVPLLLVMAPLLMVGAVVKVKSLPAVIICSLALSIVTALVTVKLVESRVMAKSVRFKAATVSLTPKFNVVMPPSVTVPVVAVKVAPEESKDPAPVNERMLPETSRVPPAIVVAAGMVTVPLVLDISPKLMIGAAVKIRLFPAVMICSSALSIVTALVTIRLVESRVKAKSKRFKVPMVTLPALNVVFPPNKRVPVVALNDAPETSRVPVPVRDRMLPETLKIPLSMVLAAGIVMVPPELVICPRLIVGAVVKVRSFPPVMILSLPLLMTTVSSTSNLDPRVRALSPSAKAVTRRLAALVNVASTVNDRLVGAANALPLVFRLPFRTRVLSVISKVPLLAIPLIVILPPVLVS